jgi:hypothetical protein
MGGWPWPLDAVQGFFTGMWSDLWSAISSVADRVWGFFSWLAGEIWTHLSSLWNQLWGGLTWLSGEIWGRIQWLRDALWGMISYQLNQIYQFLLGIPGAIGRISSQVWAQVGPAFTSLWNQVWGGLKWVWDQTWGGLQWAWDQTWGGLNWLWKELWKGLTWAGEQTWGFFTWLWNEQIKPGLQWLWDKVPTLTDIGNAVSLMFLQAWDFLIKGFEPLFQFFRPEFWIGIQDKLNQLLNTAKGIADGWVDKVLHEFTHASPMTPEEAASRVPIAIAAGLGAELGVDALGMIGEALGLGQLEVPYWAMSALLRTIGVDGIVSRFLMMRMDKAIIRPYEFYLNKELRTYILSLMQANEMLFHGQIGPEKWFETYSYWGWPTEAQTAWYNTIDRVPTLMNLFRIADVTTIDLPWAQEQLAQGGFRAVEQDKLLDAIQRYPFLDEVKLVRQKAISDYADGDLPDSDFISILSELQQKPEEIALCLRAAQLSERASLKKELIGIQGDAYSKDQITDTQLQATLIGYGMSPERATAKVARLRIRKLKLGKADQINEQKGIYASYVITRRKEGFVTEDGAVAELAQLTWGPAGTQEIMKAANLAYDTEYKQAVVKIYRDWRYKEQLTDQELDEALKPIVVDDDKRTAIVAQEQIRALPRPKTAKSTQ